MKYIVVDLEMNPLGKGYPEQKRICKNEVIEIGAVVLNEAYQEIDSFKMYVKPQMNIKVEDKVKKLTKITMDTLNDAPCFEEAAKCFLSWCVDIQDEICFVEWSETDAQQFTSELIMKGIELPEKYTERLHGWYDFQKEFGDALGLDNRVSLQNAMQYAGLDFEGQMHDALYDARNTAVLMETVRTQELRKRALENVIQVLNAESIGSTLGDMFDFSKLCLSA